MASEIKYWLKREKNHLLQRNSRWNCPCYKSGCLMFGCVWMLGPDCRPNICFFCCMKHLFCAHVSCFHSSSWASSLIFELFLLLHSFTFSWQMVLTITEPRTPTSTLHTSPTPLPPPLPPPLPSPRPPVRPFHPRGRGLAQAAANQESSCLSAPRGLEWSHHPESRPGRFDPHSPRCPPLFFELICVLFSPLSWCQFILSKVSHFSVNSI